MKKAKHVKSGAPIYGAADDVPLSLDMLAIAATRSHMQRLFLWLDIVQRETASTAPRNDEARQFAKDCRALIPQIVWYSVYPPRSAEETCEAMLAMLELGFAFHAFAISNNLQAGVQSWSALISAGKKGAAKRHSQAQKQRTLRKWAKAQRRCGELIRAGVPKAKALKALSREFSVKPSTLEKKLRSSGHLPRARRNSSP